MVDSDDGADDKEADPGVVGSEVLVDGTDEGMDVTSVVVTKEDGTVGVVDKYTDPVVAVVEYGTLDDVSAASVVTLLEPLEFGPAELVPPELLVPVSVLGKHTVKVDSSPVVAVVVAGLFEVEDIVVHSESAIGVDSKGVCDVGSSDVIDGPDKDDATGSTGSEATTDPVMSVLIVILDAQDHSAESTVILDGPVSFDDTDR